MPRKNDKLVVIKKFDERSEAELAKDYLESCDIDAVILEDEVKGKKGKRNSDGPAQILVHPDDAEEAKKLLKEAEEDAPDYDLDDEDEDEDEDEFDDDEDEFEDDLDDDEDEEYYDEEEEN